MLDNGFIGHFPEGSTLPLALQCRSQDLQVANPSANPTYTIVSPEGAVSDTGSLTRHVPGLTGFRMGNLPLTQSSKWQPGVLYTIVFSYVTDGENRACLSTFQVV